VKVGLIKSLEHLLSLIEDAALRLSLAWVCHGGSDCEEK
jgi:hypothetical protein